MSTTITNARVVLPDRILPHASVVVTGGRIAAVVEAGADASRADAAHPGGDTIDVGGRLLVPGLVDMHVHGGGGGSFQSGAAQDVHRVVGHHRSRGTTTMVASLVTRPVDEMVESVSRLGEFVDDGVIAGVHLEGPFLSAARCGAHDPALLRDPDPDSLRRLLTAGRGGVAMVTLAPERHGGLDAVRTVVDAGGLAAVGHTDASYDMTLDAIQAGARVGTHLFNAMPSLHHRSPGPVLALLQDERVVVELIHDRQHLHPAIMRHALAAAGADRTAFVSDAIAAAGLPDDAYLLGDLEVVVVDGIARLVEGGSLAGSTITVHQALVNAVGDGTGLCAAVRVAATTPARALGLADRIGRIAPGLEADLLVLGDDLSVDAVMRHGDWIGVAPS